MKTNTKITIAALLSLSLTAGCTRARSEQKPAKPVRVKTVETHSTVTSVRYSASIRPAAQVDVAFKVSGYVDSIAKQRDMAGQWRNLQAGDVVHEGAVLARLRQSDYVARVNESRSQHGEANAALQTNSAQLQESITAVETSRAQVSDAQASFDRAQLDYERARILFGTQSITKPDYDASKAQYEIARAKLEVAKDQLLSAEARVATSRAQISAAESKIKTMEAYTYTASIPLQDTNLRAPMTAVVIDRKIEVGALVSTGATAFTLANLTSVKAAFGVPDLALQTLKMGDTLKITTDALPGEEMRGHISRISPSADQNSRVFDVEVTIPNPEGKLKPGMIAALSVGEGAGAPADLPMVPLTAITRAKDNLNSYAVLVVEQGEGKAVARLRTVTLGESFGNSIVVKAGVRPGETVITTGVTQVADGEVVQVIP
jgi:RND family efflux transporter MFP subunit